LELIGKITQGLASEDPATNKDFNYCIENKGLVIYAWVILSNHIHLIMGSNDEELQAILRDLKK